MQFVKKLYLTMYWLNQHDTIQIVNTASQLEVLVGVVINLDIARLAVSPCLQSLC